MQFIENNVLGVRAALYSLTRSGGGPRFILFPMIHIGSPTYYSFVHKKLNECDVILYEGVRTLRVRLLTLSYRLVARRKRLGLVAQDTSLLRGLRGQLIHADMGPGEFSDSWSQVPWPYRLAVLLIAPWYGAYQYLTATKESIGRRMKREDLASAEEVAGGNFGSALDDAIITRRDAKLVATIDSMIASASASVTVGVVYGAGHMRAVTAALMENHRYVVKDAEWLSVFDYADTE